MTDYNVKLQNLQDLEKFSEAIKHAACDAFPERFGSERLRETKMRYDDFFHKSDRGHAYPDGSIEVRQTESALQLAGTVVHELAHVLVGTHHSHDTLWHEAAVSLGLKYVNAGGQNYKPDHFSEVLLQAIRDALDKLYKEIPSLVYPADMPIPMPPHWGMPDCPYAISDPEDCPNGHKKHILQFQLDGVRWMLQNENPGILYADDPGLGKTVGMMMYINATHPKSIIIICPNNVKLVWRDHFRDMVVHQDLQDDLEIAYSQLWTFSPVSIMNYEAARRFKDAIKKMPWNLAIFDEFHYCKTPNAARSRAVFGIKADKAIGLSGTPIVNYIDEIFPLIHYLDPVRWPEFGTFASHYMIQGDRFGRNLTEFNSRLRNSIMLRRFKKDVLAELPKKRRQMVQIEIDDDIRELIEEEKRLFNELDKDLDYESVKMLNAMRNESDTAIDDIDWAKLIEELKFTKQYAFERMAIIAHQIGLAKVPHAIDYITDALENKDKVVVFGHHRDVLTAIAKHFAPNSVLLIGGGANQAEATRMAASRFSNDNTCNVFVGGITLAAGYSLKGASTVIFVEEDWVPGIMTQAEDRAHGIGRGDAEATSLMIHHLCFEDSLDTYKAKKTIRKQKSIDRATGKV